MIDRLELDYLAMAAVQDGPSPPSSQPASPAPRAVFRPGSTLAHYVALRMMGASPEMGRELILRMLLERFTFAALYRHRPRILSVLQCIERRLSEELR